MTVKTSGSKKRKNMGSTELSLENLGAEDALQKLVSFSQAVSNHVSVELRVRAERAEQALKKQEKMWKATNEDLLKRVELLSKEKAEKEEEHIVEMEEVIVEAKASTALAIWEAKIRLAEDATNAGSWDLPGWHVALAQLTGESARTSQDLEGHRPKAGEEEEIPGDDDMSKV